MGNARVTLVALVGLGACAATAVVAREMVLAPNRALLVKRWRFKAAINHTASKTCSNLTSKIGLGNRLGTLGTQTPTM